MSARPGAARETLREILAAGASGTYEALAELAGLSADTARATLKEMSRCGEAGTRGRTRRAGRVGRAPEVYGRQVAPFDALALVRQAWR